MNNEYKCGCCGQTIQEWDDVEFTGEEVILTYKCDCGRYAEIHNKLLLDNIKVIEEGCRND